MSVTDDRLVNLLGVAAIGIADAIRFELAAVSDLDEAATTTLVVLLDFSPSGTVRRLADALGVTHSGAVRLVDRLEASGYVVRRPGSDARSLTVALTRSGRRLAEKIRAARHNAIAATVAGLSTRQSDQLTTAVEAIAVSVTEQRLAVRRAGGQPAGGALCRLCDFAACGRPEGHCPVQQTAAASL